MSRKRRKFVIDSDGSDDDNAQSSKSSKSKASPTVESTTRKKLSSDSLSESSEEEEWTFDTESGKAPKKPKKDDKKEEKKVANSADSIDSSEDEGELTPSDQDSGSDDSGETDNFDDGLDENFIGDTEDRDKLMNMTEAERERVLFERMEKRESMKIRQEIQKKLKQEKKKKEAAKLEAERKKTEQENKAATVRSQRARKPHSEDKGKGKAFEELKAKRQAHKEKLKNDSYKKSPTREMKPLLKIKDVYSDDDDDDKSISASATSESESESDRAPSPIAVRCISGKADLSKIRISRFKLEKWVHLPFFKDTICGCYIRIGIGEKLGRKVYRVAEIFDVVETGKEYNLGKSKTNLGLKVRHGIAESVYRLEFVSNQDFTDSEFQKWKNTMDEHSLSLPTLKHVNNKVKEIEGAINHIFSESEIEKIVQEKEKFRKGPRNFAQAKSNMISAKFQAEALGDYSEVEKLKADLEDLETEADRKSKQRNKGLNSISYINDKNRKSTTNRIEEVLRAEFLEKISAAPSPFCRRQTVPVMVTPKHRNQTTIVEVLAPTDVLQKLTKEREEAEKSVQEEQHKKTKLEVSKKVKNIIDPFEMHNDCDIDIDIGPIDTPSCFTTPKVRVQRRGMDLTEYKKKSGLM